MKDPDGRFIFLQACIDDSPYTLASVYRPNLDQLNFLYNLLPHLTSFQNGPIILGGDLNLIADPKLDYLNQKLERVGGYLPKSRRRGFSQLLQQYQLTDIWRHLHPGERDYSYFSAQYYSYSRIDYLNSLRTCPPFCPGQHALPPKKRLVLRQYKEISVKFKYEPSMAITKQLKYSA